MALEVTGLKRSYGDFMLSLDLTVEEGETLALVGPSGSGKSTALNLIAGLAAPEAGKVIIDGEDLSGLPSWKRNISVVFQDLALFPHLSVGGNITYGLFIKNVPRKERQRVIDETLKIVRLPGNASRRIHTLSGGERQRVAIARALASNPRALLLDEPFSSLDLPLRREMRKEFLEIRSHSKAPCVFVTHDREEAMSLGDKLALMSDGKIIESGTGRVLFLTPKTVFAANFFGAGQILPCKIMGEREAGTEVSTPLGILTVPFHGTKEREKSKVKLFIPNDAIRLEDPFGAAGWKLLSARCTDSVFNGPNLIIKFSPPFEIAAGPRTNPPAPGNVLNFWVDQSLTRFVEADA